MRSLPVAPLGAEHSTIENIDRLTHEYALRDTLVTATVGMFGLCSEWLAGAPGRPPEVLHEKVWRTVGMVLGVRRRGQDVAEC